MGKSPSDKKLEADYESPTVLVAVVPSPADWHIVLKQGWYRIPTHSAPPMVRHGMVTHVAFYHTKAFEDTGSSIRWYARVRKISVIERRNLFPEEPIFEKSLLTYYVFDLDDLMMLRQPIRSLNRRRVIFIPTTMKKLLAASDINDIYHYSPLEDTMWLALKQRKIAAERQLVVQFGKSRYILDFAIFCKSGNINIECDGAQHYTKPEHVLRDQRRTNDLHSAGWKVFRFGSEDLSLHMDESMQKVHDGMKSLGGPASLRTTQQAVS